VQGGPLLISSVRRRLRYHLKRVEVTSSPTSLAEGQLPNTVGDRQTVGSEATGRHRYESITPGI
jgi:hypothetical protein